MMTPNERLSALLWLTTQQQQTDEPCPDNEQIAALIDEQLKARDRSAMLTHLARCPSCFALWRDLREEQEVQPLSRQFSTTQRQRFLPWLGLSFAAMASIMLLLFFKTTTPPTFDQQMASSYAHIGNADGATQVQALMTSATRATSLTPLKNNRDDAFLRGMQIALDRLHNPSQVNAKCEGPDCDERRVFAQHYGEWVALSLSACIHPDRVAPAFWTTQASAFQALWQNAQGQRADRSLEPTATSVCDQAKRSFLQYPQELM